MATNGLPGHVASTSASPLTADIIGGVRVERRIEIDQVNVLGPDVVGIVPVDVEKLRAVSLSWSR